MVHKVSSYSRLQYIVTLFIILKWRLLISEAHKLRLTVNRVVLLII